MADVKISALPSATTPLAGTEVLPIVQGGTTDQVSVANLTAGRTVAAAGLTVDANSAGAAVRITQTGAGNALLVEDSTNPDATPFVVNGDGRVIVGATTSLTSRQVEIQTSDVPLAIIRSNDSAFAAAWTDIYRRRATGALSNGDLVGGTRFFGYEGTNYVATAQIEATIDNAIGAGDMPGRLVFSTTADGASSPTERMRIDSAGNVGVGGAAAAYSKVEVKGTLPSSSNTTFTFSALGTVPSTTTSNAHNYESVVTTQAASFTLNNFRHFRAFQGTIGATSAITNQFGFAADASLTGATNNYGFYSNIASGSGRWNFYANGTAANAFAGSSRFGAVTAPVNTVDITGSLGRGAPVTKTGDFTLAATENWVICNGTGSITVTLPAASSWTGREVMIKTIAAQTVVSNASNVVPIDGAAAGTAILAGTAGKWATLVSDGTNWVIMQAN